MAAASLLMLIDDIASMLDDVALMTKVAAKKTAGVLGDDLALNAQQVSGVQASRELPVVWAVARGSLMNKAILVPAALAISAFAPWLITPLLMVGGAFLCYEGAEKLLHSLTRRRHRAHQSATAVEPSEAPMPAVQTLTPAAEKEKVKGAVRTDFILSAEVIAIALGTVADAPFAQQVVVMVGVAVIMTIFVYGIVAGIVKLDDLGLYLSRRAGAAARATGRGILALAPWLMKALSVLGTAAMFLVGGGILVHGVPAFHHAVEAAAGTGLLASLVQGLAGVAAGAVVLAAVSLVQRLRGRAPGHPG
ncbi:DUF808 domain-containing protein [uncultured Xylophilus sp.]|uniref:DUF808 domain-containing protein n=1 Tax=uncultured Xylophilus sp. TaxID=296832 RepID=UPI0025FED679|nr:DUF808 domain-containing protein [uncultured Xylophilus sp.]